MKFIKTFIIASVAVLALTACGENGSDISREENQNIVDDTGNAVKDITDGAGNVVDDAGDAVKDAGEAIGDGAEDLTK